VTTQTTPHFGVSFFVVSTTFFCWFLLLYKFNNLKIYCLLTELLTLLMCLSRLVLTVSPTLN